LLIRVFDWPMRVAVEYLICSEVVRLAELSWRSEGTRVTLADIAGPEIDCPRQNLSRPAPCCCDNYSGRAAATFATHPTAIPHVPIPSGHQSRDLVKSPLDSYEVEETSAEESVASRLQRRGSSAGPTSPS
jgi:hypothetical protein